MSDDIEGMTWETNRGEIACPWCGTLRDTSDTYESEKDTCDVCGGEVMIEVEYTRSVCAMRLKGEPTLDIAAARRVTGAMLRGYLERRGWTQRTSSLGLDTTRRVWTPRETGGVGFGAGCTADGAELDDVAMALDVIAGAEGRERNDVLRDVLAEGDANGEGGSETCESTSE